MPNTIQAYDYFDRQNTGTLGSNWSSSQWYIQDGMAVAPLGNHYSIFTGYTPVYPSNSPYNWTYEARMSKPTGGSYQIALGIVHQSYPPSGFALSNGPWPIYREFLYYQNSTNPGSFVSRLRYSNGAVSSTLFDIPYTWSDNTYKVLKAEYDILSNNSLSYYIDGVLLWQGPVPNIFNINIQSLRPLYGGLIWNSLSTGNAGRPQCDWFTVGRYTTGSSYPTLEASTTYSLTGISFTQESTGGSSLPQPDTSWEEEWKMNDLIEKTDLNYIIYLPTNKKPRRKYTLRWTNRTKTEKDSLLSVITGQVSWNNQEETVYMNHDGKIDIEMLGYNRFNIQASFIGIKT